MNKVLTKSRRSLGMLLSMLLRLPRRVVKLVASFLNSVLRAAADIRKPLITIYNPARHVQRRAADLTLSINGVMSRVAREATWQLNDGPRKPITHPWPRANYPEFVIDVEAKQLQAGTNLIWIRASSLLGSTIAVEHRFQYDSKAPNLPIHCDWAEELDAQDGYWERYEIAGKAQVRPRPGHESFDRVLLVAGAFPGSRELNTTVTFHGAIEAGRPHGFGVMPLWGGRPAAASSGPRSGWLFGMAGFYSPHSGVGLEFSSRLGDKEPDWVASYQSLVPLPNQTYAIRVQAIHCAEIDGRHLGYLQRLKWWPVEGPEPHHWLELCDVEGSRIPERDYGAAVFAHYCQASFGTVQITRPLIDPAIAADSLRRRLDGAY